MQIIEANAYRSWTLKVPKLDYRGEERFRPNEDGTIHAGLRATLTDQDDVEACQQDLDALCQRLVEGAKAQVLADYKAALQMADNPAAAHAAQQRAAAPAATFTTADRLPPAPRATPLPAALKDVSEGAVDEIRRISAALDAKGRTYDGPAPASEAEAQDLITRLRARLAAPDPTPEQLAKIKLYRERFAARKLALPSKVEPKTQEEAATLIRQLLEAWKP